MKTLILIILMSLFNATVLISLDKWGFFKWIHTYKPKWLKWYPECWFCYGFQIAVLTTACSFFILPLLGIYIQWWMFPFIPFCCASLTYKLTS